MEKTFPRVFNKTQLQLCMLFIIIIRLVYYGMSELKSALPDLILSTFTIDYFIFFTYCLGTNFPKSRQIHQYYPLKNRMTLLRFVTQHTFSNQSQIHSLLHSLEKDHTFFKKNNDTILSFLKVNVRYKVRRPLTS